MSIYPFNENWYSIDTNDYDLKVFELRCLYLFYLKYLEPMFWNDRILWEILSIFTHRNVPDPMKLEMYKLQIDNKINIADKIWIRRKDYSYHNFINDFEVLICVKKPNSTKTLKMPPKGIDYMWLHARFFKCGNIDEDLPIHATLLTCDSAGKIYLNELILLQQALYSYVKAEYFSSLREYIINNQLNDLYIHQVNRQISNNYMNAIMMIHSFVECFINSIRDDYIARNSLAESKKGKIILGKKIGKCQLELYRTRDKLVNLPYIINQHKMRLNNLVSSDELSKYDELVKFRDSIVHPSIIEDRKRSIHISIEDWKNMALASLLTCTSITLKFWKACKNNVNSEPKYLYNLNMSELLNHGHKWFEEDRKLMDLFTHQYIKK